MFSVHDLSSLMHYLSGNEVSMINLVQGFVLKLGVVVDILVILSDRGGGHTGDGSQAVTGRRCGCIGGRLAVLII